MQSVGEIISILFHYRPTQFNVALVGKIACHRKKLFNLLQNIFKTDFRQLKTLQKS